MASAAMQHNSGDYSASGQLGQQHQSHQQQQQQHNQHEHQVASQSFAAHCFYASQQAADHEIATHYQQQSHAGAAYARYQQPAEPLASSAPVSAYQNQNQHQSYPQQQQSAGASVTLAAAAAAAAAQQLQSHAYQRYSQMSNYAAAAAYAAGGCPGMEQRYANGYASGYAQQQQQQQNEQSVYAYGAYAHQHQQVSPRADETDAGSEDGHDHGGRSEGDESSQGRRERRRRRQRLSRKTVDPPNPKRELGGASDTNEQDTEAIACAGPAPPTQEPEYAHWPAQHFGAPELQHQYVYAQLGGSEPAAEYASDSASQLPAADEPVRAAAKVAATATPRGKHQQSEAEGEAGGRAGSGAEFNSQLRVLEMRKEKSRDAARSRRSKENHEFYELAKLLPLPAAITSQLDFLDKASIIRLTISFLKLRQFSVNGHPPWAPDFTTLGSVNPYSAQQAPATYQPDQRSPTSTGAGVSAFAAPQPQSAESLYPGAGSGPQQLVLAERTKNANLFDVHQGTHILQSLDGFAFAVSRDGRFLYISETVSMYLGLSQVEMTGSSVFDYTHQQDHEELARQLGIPLSLVGGGGSQGAHESTGESRSSAANCDSPAPNSVRSQYSAASQDTSIEDHVNSSLHNGTNPKKRLAAGYRVKRLGELAPASVKLESRPMCEPLAERDYDDASDQFGPDDLGARDLDQFGSSGTLEDPLVRQFCIRMKSTLTKRGCQHFKSSGYRVVHVVAHLRTYQSNDHGHLMDPLDEPSASPGASIGSIGSAGGRPIRQAKRRGPKPSVMKQDAGCKAIGKPSDSNNNSALAVNRHADNGKTKIIGMVAVAIALPPPSINELRLESDTFVFRLGLDLRVTHIEAKVTELLHYPIEMIAGKSLYSLVHPADVRQVQMCHRDLLRKGQMMSGYYRILSRTGGYIWVQTCATLICNNNPLANPIPSEPRQSSSTAAPAAQYSEPALHQAASQHPLAGTKISSPSVSSHLSSQYENQDQEQCVIFVNYMITDVIDQDELLDVCQSVGPLVPASIYSNTANTFASPASSCSSPCLSSLKSTGGGGGYMTPPAASPQSHRLNHHHRSETIAKPSRSSAGVRGQGGRSSASHGKLSFTKSPQVHYPSLGANGQDKISLALGYVDGASYYGGQATASDGINLALAATKFGSQSVAAPAGGESIAVGGWSASGDNSAATLGDGQLYSMPTGGGESSASTQSAFSFGNASAGNYAPANGHTHQQHQTITGSHQQHFAGSQNEAAHQQPLVAAGYTPVAADQTSTSSGWHSSSVAVAAAAAAATNSYAHLELGAAGTHPATHHQAAAAYYNYYGYYGNKFI